MEKKTFEVWKTIELGTSMVQDVNFISEALKTGGYLINDRANDILRKPVFTVATNGTKVELVKISVANLGFENKATLREIYQTAQDLGLKLGTCEVGPELRLKYRDQPLNEWLCIAMEPIADSNGDLRVFDVGHNRVGLWLSGDSGNPNSIWDAGYQFIFCKQ